MPAEGRVDRRLSVATAATLPVVPVRIVFRTSWGGKAQIFDPAELGLPPDLAVPLMQAFHRHDAGSSPKTRRSRWRAMKQLAVFLCEDRVTCACDINAGTIQRYLAALARPSEGKQRSRATMALAFGLVRPLLEGMESADPTLFGSPLAIPWNAFPNAKSHDPKPRLSEPQLRAILAAAYEEIDAAWATFQYGQAVARLPVEPPGVLRGHGLDRWIWRLYRANGGIMPSMAEMKAASFCPETLKRYGWLEGMAQRYHLTTHTLAPFYIALAIQLAANPEPLRIIRRDCLVPHPIDEDRMMVEWLKRKTGKNPKLQRRAFDRRRPRSAPKLIEMLLEMTAPLVPHVPIEERDSLFLVRFMAGAPLRGRPHVAGLPSMDAITDAVARFVRRSNKRIACWNAEHPDRPRELLPAFPPGQLRGSVATAHYLATGDLAGTSALLNHASLVTTDTYVEGPAVRRMERETIARLQRLMVAWVVAPEPEAVPIADHAPVTALFGHRCLAPVEAGATGPRVCRKLGGCLACPGLVVPIDVERCARVMQAHAHLIEARERIEGPRWSLFYAPSLAVLENDLMPAFPSTMRRKASALIPALPPLPEIE